MRSIEEKIDNVLLGLFLVLFLLSCGEKESVNKKKEKAAEQITSIDTINIVNKEKNNDQFDQKQKSVEELWNDFRAAKASVEEAKEAGDIEEVTVSLILAARYSNELNRPDITAWQLNNIGYYSILEFKKRTDYNTRMAKIESMRRGEEKIRYIKETKKVFKDNLELLTNANKYLEEAYDLDSNLDDDNRTQKIYSNLKFVDWVRNFVREK